jgi:hypothetical protein
MTLLINRVLCSDCRKPGERYECTIDEKDCYVCQCDSDEIVTCQCCRICKDAKIFVVKRVKRGYENKEVCHNCKRRVVINFLSKEVEKLAASKSSPYALITVRGFHCRSMKHLHRFVNKRKEKFFQPVILFNNISEILPLEC